MSERTHGAPGAPASGGEDERMGHLQPVFDDHEEVLGVMGEVLAACYRGDAPEARSCCFGRMRALLLSHARAEEEVLYARIYRSPAMQPMIERLLDEHTEMEALLTDLWSEEDDGTWCDLFWTLKTSVELHAEQEEKEVLPVLVEQLDGAEVDDLVARYASCRARWARHIGPLEPTAGNAEPMRAPPSH